MSRRKMRAQWWLLAVALVGILLSQTAAAYPQYVGRGEFNCSECHYSPTGGGLINAWGRQSREASFAGEDALGGDPDDWWGHEDATLDVSSQPSELRVDVGAEARLAALVGPAAVVVPMLLEAGAAATYGQLQFYATGATRKGSPGLPLLLQSREHWLRYGIDEQWSVRAGKLVLPFGLRMPDHTQYVREDLGFGPWGQTYGASVDWLGESATLSFAGFIGDWMVRDPQLQESGGVVRGSYRFADRFEVALSGLVARSEATEGWSTAVSLRGHVGDSGYVLGELAAQNRDSRQTDSSLQSQLAFLRVGYFFLPELDAHVEVGFRQVQDLNWLKRSRVGLGAAWQAWHWLELTPQILVETTDGLGSEFIGMLQAHLLY